MIASKSFSELFDFQKKSKIKAGDGLKNNRGKYPFYTSSNQLTKSIDEYLYEKPSLILGTGGLASIHYSNEKFAVSTDCLVASPKSEDIVFPKFVFHYLSGNIHLLENGFKGAGLKHISKGYISNLKIPLPILETQKRIAQILDDAAALRIKTEQLLKSYDLLAQSLFLDMFGDLYLNKKNWKNIEISKVCLEIVDCVNRTAPVVDYETPFKMIRTTNVKKRSLELEGLRCVTEETYKIWTRRLLPTRGDLIFTREAPVGEAAIIDTDMNLFLGQRTMQYRVNPRLANNTFILYQLTSKFLEIQINKISSGSTVKHLSVPLCKKFTLRLPPIELQNQFAEKIELIEKQKELAKQELKESEDLFNCLLQKAFKGELV